MLFDCILVFFFHFAYNLPVLSCEVDWVGDDEFARVTFFQRGQFVRLIAGTQCCCSKQKNCGCYNCLFHNSICLEIILLSPLNLLLFCLFISRILHKPRNKQDVVNREWPGVEEFCRGVFPSLFCHPKLRSSVSLEFVPSVPLAEKFLAAFVQNGAYKRSQFLALRVSLYIL